MNLQTRLAIFFERLDAAPAAASAPEAMALVCRLIEAVEDEHCPLPRETPPPSLVFTGRMYAPQADRIRRSPSGTLVAETRRHLIRCFPDGKIEIEDADTKTVALTKRGKTK